MKEIESNCLQSLINTRNSNPEQEELCKTSPRSPRKSRGHPEGRNNTGLIGTQVGSLLSSKEKTSSRSLRTMTDIPITDGELKRVLDSALETENPNCPICTGEIGFTTSEVYDRECQQCKTKFNLRKVDEDSDLDREAVPTIMMRTTPVRRKKQKLWQKANVKAALESFDNKEEEENEDK